MNQTQKVAGNLNMCLQKKPFFLFIRRIFFALLIAKQALGYDYSHCLKYYEAATTRLDGGYAISLANGTKGQYHLYYSTTAPRNVKVLKSDPFVGLYLIAAPRTKQSYNLLALDTRTLNDSNLALISYKHVEKGRITARQNGFLNYGRFSASTSPNSVLGNICYQIYGIGTQNGFIEKRYIDRFLTQKYPYYGDLGIRFNTNSKRAIVASIHPFIPNNPFMPNDEILSINGKPVQSGKELEWIMSNLKKNSLAQVKLKRDGKVLNLNARVYQRYGGFLLKETFLEQFGIDIDDEMIIQNINPSLAGRFSALRKGDRILWINKEPIITQATTTAQERYNNLKELLSKTIFDNRFEGKMQLLIMRDNLEIFIKL